MAAVDLVGAVAGLEDHAGDSALALAGGRVAGVGGQVQGLAGDGLRLAGLLGPILLGHSDGLLGGLGAGVLGALGLLALLLEHEVRLQVEAGDDLLFSVVGLAAAALGAGRRFLGGRRGLCVRLG